MDNNTAQPLSYKTSRTFYNPSDYPRSSNFFTYLDSYNLNSDSSSGAAIRHIINPVTSSATFNAADLINKSKE